MCAEQPEATDTTTDQKAGSAGGSGSDNEKLPASIDWKLPLTAASLVNVIDLVRRDTSLPKFGAHSSFTARAESIAGNPHLLKHLARYDLPLVALASSVRNSSLFAKDGGKEANAVTIDDLFYHVIKASFTFALLASEWFMNQAAVELYALTGAHDFFLLHGVTSAQALRTALQFAYDDTTAGALVTERQTSSS